jgi:hypothetical protein
MLKRILLVTFILLLVLQGAAFAQTGSVILEDMTYGVVIGAMLGGAVYLLGNEEDALVKDLSYGAALGAIVGFALGVTEIRGVVEIEDNEMKVAFPTVIIQERDDALMYSANLLKVKY